jgi:GTP cyclohydrolase FolE2
MRRLVGVEAQGMTACPCAQELGGFTDADIARVLAA